LDGVPDAGGAGETTIGGEQRVNMADPDDNEFCVSSARERDVRTKA
jgi:hypothetical protein